MSSDALEWQKGVWDKISKLYVDEIDVRFTGVVDGVLQRAALQPGERVLDLGTGTGSVAAKAAPLVAPDGDVLAVDISPEMLEIASARAAQLGDPTFRVAEGMAESIPSADASVDIVLSSLCLMFAVDRAKAAQEIARVLRPGGRLVAAVWGRAEENDLVLLQSTAAKFAPTPPVRGVGPGALADPKPFVEQLAAAGIDAHVEREVLGFDCPDFATAWDVFAGVTAANLPEEQQRAARDAVREAMWPLGDGPRHFDNATLFIVGTKQG